MEVLSIGNSFSQDATRYLHQIARSAGVELTTVNLYIPGCPLDRHYRNMLSQERAYTLMFNGESTGFTISLDEALLNREWDVITLQQQSARSADYNTFQPYGMELFDYVRTCAPKARILLHQTWPLGSENPRLAAAGYATPQEMFQSIEENYQRFLADVGADGLITSGKLLMTLLEKGVESVHRDGLHTTKGLGRYALGLLWFKTLTGKRVADIPFDDFDEPVSPEEVALAKACVESL